MSRKSRFEYIGEKRRAYAKSAKAKRSHILDEVCETLSFTRKYVIKLLTGDVRAMDRRVVGVYLHNNNIPQRILILSF